MTAPVEAPDRTGADAPELLHVVCICQQGQKPQLAVCDTDTTDDTYYDGGPIQPCLVCKDHIINKLPCRRCGFRLP